MNRKQTMAKKRLYRVQFVNQGKVYELYARRIEQSNLFGFIAIGDFVFGEKSTPMQEMRRRSASAAGAKRRWMPSSWKSFVLS